MQFFRNCIFSALDRFSLGRLRLLFRDELSERTPMRSTPSSLQQVLRYLALGVVASSIGAVTAADWPHQRGPGHNGSVSADAKVPSALPDDPRIVWRKPVTDGFAAPIVSAGRVIYGDFQNGKETFHAVKLADGTPIWSEALDGPHRDGFGTGPRCAPVSDGELVLMQSCKGELHCRAATDGALVWKTNYLADFGAPYTGEKGKTEGAARHGYTASPCFDGDHIIALVGAPGAGVVCFERDSGKVVWKSQDDQAAYAPPLVATLAGVKQVVCFTVSGAMGLDRKDGTLLWRVPLSTEYGRHVIAPVVVGDLVFVGSHEAGLVATRIVNEGGTIRAEEAWKHGRELGPNISTPLPIGDHLYMLVKEQVLCMEAKTGKTTWAQDGLILTPERRAFAAFIGLKDRIAMLNAMGELILFKANPQKYEEISRIQACGKNWCHPAYANGKFVVRDSKRLLCLDLLSEE